jgi:diguanylate cyclase (GGDEF)-like protein
LNLIHVRNFARRYRALILEAAALAVPAVIGPILAYDFDFFDNGTGPHPKTIELDEGLLLCGLLLAVALALFATRRYFEQKRETLRRAAAERKIRELAFQDALTGLPNRRQFDAALQAALDSPPRAQAMHGVFLLDLNGFKQINDVHGHATGDDVLIAVAQRLLAVMRDGDLIARFGGDEFAILAQHLLGPESAKNLARRVIESLQSPIVIDRKTFRVGVAIGIALVPNDARTRKEILRKADVALYRAKAERRSAMRFFEEHMDRHIHEHDRMEREFRAALAADEVRAVFEPSIDLTSGRVVCFEVVPRWIHAEWGEVAPQRFIPVAEHAGLIHDMAERLLRQACEVARRWPPQIRLAIDLFPSQLSDLDLPLRMLATLAEHGIAASRFELEVTESSLVRDITGAEATLAALHDAGVRITLDHFGTGYSTLYHLRKCKLDKIKIDPIFVAGMNAEHESARLVGGLVGLGHGLGLTVAASGIGNAGEGASLLGQGCHEGQGGWVGAPLSAQDTLRYFAADAPSQAPAVPTLGRLREGSGRQ